MVSKVPQPNVAPSLAAMIKPHVKYWAHGLYFADADRVCSAGRSIPEAIERWHIRWSAMEAISPLARKDERPVVEPRRYWQCPVCHRRMGDLAYLHASLDFDCLGCGKVPLSGYHRKEY